MTTMYYGDHVRINYGEPGAWAVGDDVVVERKVGEDWIRVQGFNSMSNDWAYTEAVQIARKTQMQMAGIMK